MTDLQSGCMCHLHRQNTRAQGFLFVKRSFTNRKPFRGLKVSVDSIFQEWKQRLLFCFLPAALPLLFHTPASSVESGRLTVNKHPPPSHTLCSFNLIYF